MASGIKNLLEGLLSGFSKEKGGSVLGIDISSSTVKIVQLRRKKGRAVLETYGALALGPYAGVDEGKATALPAETVSQALTDLLREAKVSTKNCGVSIPMRSSMVMVIGMPDLGEKRLREMIPIEVRKYIPVNISEVLLDWKVIPRAQTSQTSLGSGTVVGGEGTLQTASVGQGISAQKDHREQGSHGQGRKAVEVLVVAIHKETINRFQKIVSGASLSPSFFEIEVFSTIRAVSHNARSTLLIFDFGAASTKLLIVDHGVLRESHVIGRGSQHITRALAQSMGISEEKAENFKKGVGLSSLEDEKHVREVAALVLDSVFAEANQVMLQFEKKRNVNISAVMLTGGGVLFSGLLEQAQKAFQVEVSVADPFSHIETPAFLEETLRKAGPEFTVALGSALRKLEEVE